MQWLWWIKGGAGLWSRSEKEKCGWRAGRGPSHGKGLSLNIYSVHFQDPFPSFTVCEWKWKLCYKLRASLCCGGDWGVVATADSSVRVTYCMFIPPIYFTCYVTILPLLSRFLCLMLSGDNQKEVHRDHCWWLPSGHGENTWMHSEGACVITFGTQKSSFLFLLINNTHY